MLKGPDGGWFVLLPDGTAIETDAEGHPILDKDGGLKYVGLPGLHGLLAASKPDSCELRLQSMGSAEAAYTLHACGEHLEAAKAAEAAAAAGTAEGWKQAADIWREELGELYQVLADAGDGNAKAAALYDLMMFNAYLANYETMSRAADEVTVQKTIAEQLRLRCTELCCILHTAPDKLPDSLAGGYALADDTNGIPGREIEAMNGSEAVLRERYTAAGARTLDAVKGTLDGAKTSQAQANAFLKAQAAWQTSLDRVVNTGYKTADKEGRKAIAGCRKALDLVCAAHRTVLEMLYADAPEVTEEVIATIYRNALLDACTAFEIR